MKRDQPCDHYLGNVCSGFGGETICNFCGWDLYQHPANHQETERMFRENNGD